MTTAKTFEDLVVWQKAHQLVLAIYKLTKNFPREEIFGLTSQFRRATIPDKLRHLNIAQGSLEEARYYLILSHDLQYGDTLDLREDSGEVSRILEGYMKTMKKKK